MTQKHELMARIQAARQSAPRVVEAESQKAYPPDENKSLNILHLVEDLPSAPEAAVCPKEVPIAAPEEMEKESRKEGERTAYTTISVPRQCGKKAKLYATFLQVNMAEFASCALDAYILQLQETGKLPKLNL